MTARISTLFAGPAAAVLLVLASWGCAAPDQGFSRKRDGVRIEGSPDFVSRIEEAFGLLAHRSPACYAVLTNNVGIVRQAKHSGMKAAKHPPVFELNERSAFYSLTWCAGVLAHDSFHSKLYHDYKREHRLHVPAKEWTGREAERKCLEHQLRALKEIAAPELEVRHCLSNSLDYINVPYRNRNW